MAQNTEENFILRAKKSSSCLTKQQNRAKNKNKTRKKKIQNGRREKAKVSNREIWACIEILDAHKDTKYMPMCWYPMEK